MNALARETGLYLPSVSRAHTEPEWKGAAGRAEDFFKEDRLAEFERSVGLGEGELTPKNAAILICGLQGTIGSTITRLLPRGFIPDNRKIRAALEVPESMPATIFYEAYDTTPPIDLKDEALVAKLRAQLHAALAGQAAT
ncbi:MAG: hypothetical protein R3B09_22450 [Nannocystaceae bacterium]